MSPFEIGILIHYHAHVGDHEACVNDVPIWRETITKFQVNGLMEIETDHDERYPRTYRLTNKGDFYVEHGLCAVPLPVHRWEIPQGRPVS